jgi:homoserine O-acetyltransferase
MHTWLWAQKYPDMMDIAVPLASMPSPMSGRNRMLRRLLVEAIKRDPEWKDGNYTQQPRAAQFASFVYNTSTNGGNQGLQKVAPTSAQADAFVTQALSRPFAGDANDHIYQWDSSRDYDASGGLERIRTKLLVINSADDERNPPELGVMERALPRIPGAREFVIPASADTVGHGTTYSARWWKDELAKVLASTPRGSP